MLVRATSTVLAGFLAGVLCATGVARAEDAPLDPLTAAEIATTFQVIEASEQFPAGAYFPIVSLNEPPRRRSWHGRPGVRSNGRRSPRSMTGPPTAYSRPSSI